MQGYLACGQLQGALVNVHPYFQFFLLAVIFSSLFDRSM
jgi:hypothetical protein